MTDSVGIEFPVRISYPIANPFVALETSVFCWINGHLNFNPEVDTTDGFPSVVMTANSSS